MTYTIAGYRLGEPVTLTWEGQRLVGHDETWQAIVEAAREPLWLTPTGPAIESPDPSLPGHALALASLVMAVESVTGDPPDLPEGITAADVATPRDAIA